VLRRRGSLRSRTTDACLSVARLTSTRGEGPVALRPCLTAGLPLSLSGARCGAHFRLYTIPIGPNGHPAQRRKRLRTDVLDPSHACGKSASVGGTRSSGAGPLEHGAPHASAGLRAARGLRRSGTGSNSPRRSWRRSGRRGNTARSTRCWLWTASAPRRRPSAAPSRAEDCCSRSAIGASAESSRRLARLRLCSHLPPQPCGRPTSQSWGPSSHPKTSLLPSESTRIKPLTTFGMRVKDAIACAEPGECQPCGGRRPPHAEPADGPHGRSPSLRDSGLDPAAWPPLRCDARRAL
jgi:hypothetical protein